MKLHFVVHNGSTVVGNHEFANLVWALNYQGLYHFGRSPWGVSFTAEPLLPGNKPRPGSWAINLLDSSEEAGTLGYHEDEEGSNIPFSDTFCATAKEYGVKPSEVVSHEACEMAVDPYVYKPRFVEHGNKIWIVEVCDAVQGNAYDVGIPEGKTTGVVVADFCYPAWYKIPGVPGLGGRINLPETKMSFRESVSKPFTLAPEGYSSVAPKQRPEEWEQIFGEQREKINRLYLRDRKNPNLEQIWSGTHTLDFTKKFDDDLSWVK